MPGIPPAPRTFRARARRIAAGFAFVMLLAALMPQPAVADKASPDPQLKQAQHQLRQTKNKIRARKVKLQHLQKDLNRLATEISQIRETIARTRIQMGKLQKDMKPLRLHLARLQKQLDERSREAYIMGPGPAILYLLTATSAEQAASRLSLLDEMSRRDQVLATAVGNARDLLARARDALGRAQTARRLSLDRLALDQKELRRKLAESAALYAALQDQKNQILATISSIRPFAVCPVRGPHAVSNDFGYVRHEPKKFGGGTHIHQGNDIMAPMGTPIVAPFDGTAVVTSNPMGGQAVSVYGQFGYVYNAHLSAFGQLGTVTTGTVIGYVGETGDAGGPHDHFEWHPNNGPAVDPNAFLMKVC